jgi:hypothetical protein
MLGPCGAHSRHGRYVGSHVRSQTLARARVHPAYCTASDTTDASSSRIWSHNTVFVAETLLPTRNGKYRLRGYRHTVRWRSGDPGSCIKRECLVYFILAFFGVHAPSGIHAVCSLLRLAMWQTSSPAFRWTIGQRAQNHQQYSTDTLKDVLRYGHE